MSGLLASSAKIAAFRYGIILRRQRRDLAAWRLGRTLLPEAGGVGDFLACLWRGMLTYAGGEKPNVRAAAGRRYRLTSCILDVRETWRCRGRHLDDERAVACMSRLRSAARRAVITPWRWKKQGATQAASSVGERHFSLLRGGDEGSGGAKVIRSEMNCLRRRDDVVSSISWPI